MSSTHDGQNEQHPTEALCIRVRLVKPTWPTPRSAWRLSPIATQLQRGPVIYNDEEIKMVLVGKTGAGKSATGNTILGKKRFRSEFAPTAITKHCSKFSAVVDGRQVAVIDTPGLFDNSTDEETTTAEIIQSVSYASPGPHIFLITIKLGRFTEEEKQTVEKIQKIFGEEANKYSMVVFTHGDLLKGEPIERFLKKNKDLEELVAKCNGQYHVFNNELTDGSQVSELLSKIRNITQKNGRSHYTTEMFQRAEKVIEEEKQRILRRKAEKELKEQVELRRKIQAQYEKKIKEMKADKEKEEQLRAAREREMEEEIRKLNEEQQKKAREEAESSPSVIQQIGSFLKEIVMEIVRLYLNKK